MIEKQTILQKVFGMEIFDSYLTFNLKLVTLRFSLLPPPGFQTYIFPSNIECSVHFRKYDILNCFKCIYMYIVVIQAHLTVGPHSIQNL